MRELTDADTGLLNVGKYDHDRLREALTKLSEEISRRAQTVDN